MNDIEAAARRALQFLEVAYTAPIFPSADRPVRLREVAGVPSIIDDLREALAHAARGDTPPPATGEAGMSEVEKARAAVVDAAKARRAFEEGLDGVAVHPGADRERHRWYVAAENASIDALRAAEARALPEAREGKS